MAQVGQRERPSPTDLSDNPSSGVVTARPVYRLPNPSAAAAAAARMDSPYDQPRVPMIWRGSEIAVTQGRENTMPIGISGSRTRRCRGSIGARCEQARCWITRATSCALAATPVATLCLQLISVYRREVAAGLGALWFHPEGRVIDKLTTTAGRTSAVRCELPAGTPETVLVLRRNIPRVRICRICSCPTPKAAHGNNAHQCRHLRDRGEA